jgi:hypothetical protein
MQWTQLTYFGGTKWYANFFKLTDFFSSLTELNFGLIRLNFQKGC